MYWKIRQDQVQTLKSGQHGEREEYDERFADIYEQEGNGGQQFSPQYKQQGFEKGQQQWTQQQYPQQAFDKGQQQFQQGGLQQGSPQQQTFQQQGGQQQQFQGQQGGNRVMPGPDQYQTKATGTQKAVTNPAMVLILNFFSNSFFSYLF